MITGGQSRAAHPHDHHCDNDHNHHREHDHDHHIMVGVGSTISPEHQSEAAHPLPSDNYYDNDYNYNYYDRIVNMIMGWCWEYNLPRAPEWSDPSTAIRLCCSQVSGSHALI